MRMFVAGSIVLAASLLSTGCAQQGAMLRGQSPDCQCDVDYYGPECQPGCRPDHVHVDHRIKCHGMNVYPPPNDQPAVTQYPYYTFKGPDCFFHQ